MRVIRIACPTHERACTFLLAMLCLWLPLVAGTPQDSHESTSMYWLSCAVQIKAELSITLISAESQIHHSQ